MNHSLIALVFLYLSFQGSNPPASSGGPEAQVSEPQGNEIRGQSDEFQPVQTPESVPVSPDDKLLKGKADEEKARGHKSDNRTSIENLLTSLPEGFWSFVLSITSTILAGATISLAIFTKRLGESADTQNALYSRQYEVINHQTNIITEQWDLDRRRHELAESAFRAEDRPRLTLRNIFIPRLAKPGYRVAPSELEEMFQGENVGYFEVVNTGGLYGEAIQGYLCWRFTNRVSFAVVDPPWKDIDQGHVPVGEAIRVDLPRGPVPRVDVSNSYRGTCYAYLIGAIQYRDPESGIRTTAFCRRYDRRMNTLVSVEDPRYEYEE